MNRSGRTRSIGIGAAWLAALALLLNSLLTSTLLAAVAPLSSYDQTLICHAGSPGSPAADEAPDAIKPSAAHCKLCVPALAAVLPPAPLAAVFHRVAVAERRHPPAEILPKSSAPTASYESQGPPRRS